MGLVYTFRGSVHYHHGENMASCRQTWFLRSQEFYILIQRPARRRLSLHWVALEHWSPQCLPIYTSTNKATSPNSATSHGPSIFKLSQMGSFNCQLDIIFNHLGRENQSRIVLIRLDCGLVYGDCLNC